MDLFALALIELATAIRGAAAESAAAVKVDDHGHVGGGLVNEEGHVRVVTVGEGEVGDHGFTSLVLETVVCGYGEVLE